MPRSSCDHRALLPSGPPNGVRRCSLEGFASRSSLPVTSPSESARSWWCRQSCLLLAAVGRVQPHGSWHPSTIIRLQGFSSCSPVATSGRWSSTRMTTSLVVERSESGCGLPLALSFKDVHHPRWGGGRAEWELRLPRGLAVRFFLQHLGEKGVRQPCGGGELRVRGTGRLWRRQLPRVWPPAWVALVPPPALPPAAEAERGCPSTARATVAPCAGRPHPRLLPCHRPHWEVVQDVVCRGGGGGVLGWSCLHSRSEDGSEDLFVGARAAAAHWCRGGRCHWWG
jgi:hypothetical protein